MWFDVNAALAEIEPAPIATVATSATNPAHVAEVARVATPPVPKPETRVAVVAVVAVVADVATPSGPERYLAHLREIGPTTYGAAATELGWGATRAWLAEADLHADGMILIGTDGRARISKGRNDAYDCKDRDGCMFPRLALS